MVKGRYSHDLNNNVYYTVSCNGLMCSLSEHYI